MAEIPNLAGVAAKNLVETIGTGKYAAPYINWSRTMQLLRENAPGWLVDYQTGEAGGLLHRAPVGAYLLIRFRHLDGTVTPALPQAVMDNRNNAIPYDKITARNVTDTQRRGMCMAAAMTFGLAYELWAKMPLENGYTSTEDNSAPESAPKSSLSSTTKASQEPPSTKVAAEAVKESEATFREAALEKGVHTAAIDTLVTIVYEKLGGDFDKGRKTLDSKSSDELNSKYAPNEAGPNEQW